MKTKVEFRFEGRTPSINHLYGFRGYRRFIKKEGAELRSMIFSKINSKKPLNIDNFKDSELNVDIEIYEDWYTKKGKIARADIDDRAKFILDSVFKAIDVDDRNIFQLNMLKVQSDECYFIIRISNIGSI